MNVDPKITGLPLIEEQVYSVLAGRKTVHRVRAEFKPINGYDLSSSSLSIIHYHQGIPESGTILRTEIAGASVDRTYPLDCPYGKKGDSLFVQEPWCMEAGQLSFLADGDWITDFARENPEGFAARRKQGFEPHWEPAADLDRYLARAHLEITAVRVERLKSITDDQAMAEGVIRRQDGRFAVTDNMHHNQRTFDNPRDAYFWLWALSGGVLGENPWVWVLDMKLIDSNQWR